ncbi:hypothetical protein GW916_07005 [bacterium]|nr:hypothetical protein [bacterium]
MASKKSNYFPLRLNLNEVNEEPLDFNSSRASGELNSALESLIRDEDYKVEVSFQKAGNAYLVKGDIDTSLPLVCSDCGGEFNHPVRHHFEDILVVQAPYKKGDHASKNNHAHEWDEDQPQCTYLENPVVMMGDLVYEELALQEPFRPTGKLDPKHVCEDVRQIQRDWLSIGKDQPLEAEGKAANPFEALKSLKLKS